MIFLYNIFISLYLAAIRFAAKWNPKARDWLEGRKSLLERIKNSINRDDRIVWIHSSSAGEFEQAKPIIEGLKQNFPGYKILVTVFSPSGFKAAKNYELADYISYLPVDTASNARRLLEVVKPELVVFIKYDFWYHHLKTVHLKGIPLILVSAVFRENQLFFKWYGDFYKRMLVFFNHIFVQDDVSLALLHKHGTTKSSMSGDTRFDRVAAIAQNFAEVPHINKFINGNEVLVAGSTWPGDEKNIKELTIAFPHLKIILAPHEINNPHITALKSLFPEAVLYSQLNAGRIGIDEKSHILLIDNIGMLSRLYHYATITYVGGGFTKDGIHNTLEAAVYGKPVLFGPNYHKYREAKELIEAGGGFSFSNSEELIKRTAQLLDDPVSYQQACVASQEYINSKKGATEKIIDYIQANRLLTNW